MEWGWRQPSCLGCRHQLRGSIWMPITPTTAAWTSEWAVREWHMPWATELSLPKWTPSRNSSMGGVGQKSTCGNRLPWCRSESTTTLLSTDTATLWWERTNLFCITNRRCWASFISDILTKSSIFFLAYFLQFFCWNESELCLAHHDLMSKRKSKYMRINIRVGLSLSRGFGRFVMQWFSMFGKVLVHAWSSCGGLNWRILNRFIEGQTHFGTSCHAQMSLPSTNRSNIFSVQNSTPNSSMHKKFIEHEKDCMQNNQLPDQTYGWIKR